MAIGVLALDPAARSVMASCGITTNAKPLLDRVPLLECSAVAEISVPLRVLDYGAHRWPLPLIKAGTLAAILEPM